MTIDWDKYTNFTKEKFDCRETGENDMQPEALELFQRVRTAYGKPMVVISGFRSKRHSEEAKKAYPGAHTQGLAGDFMCSNGADRFALIKAAYDCGAAGIGVAKSFVHIDAGHAHAKRPALWSY
jgi:uncharacterized protein YcbK (DUF882 family)